MIVLDEQLLGLGLESELAKWYPGAIQFITDLRPNSIIKDEDIPQLLRQQNQPTFVTINERDFWRKVETDRRYCVVCFALADSHAGEISGLLRLLFRHPQFTTKAKRMGTVIRLAGEEINYYALSDRAVKSIAL